MGIEAFAIFPACVASAALAIMLIFGRQNIHHLFRTLSFSIALTAFTTVALFATVILFEFLGVFFYVEESFYLFVVAFVIYGGLRYGRIKFYFTKKELVLQGIIAVFGCMTAALCFLGWTVKI